MNCCYCSSGTPRGKVNWKVLKPLLRKRLVLVSSGGCQLYDPHDRYSCPPGRTAEELFVLDRLSESCEMLIEQPPEQPDQCWVVEGGISAFSKTLLLLINVTFPLSKPHACTSKEVKENAVSWERHCSFSDKCWKVLSNLGSSLTVSVGSGKQQVCALTPGDGELPLLGIPRKAAGCTDRCPYAAESERCYSVNQIFCLRWCCFFIGTRRFYKTCGLIML